VLGRPSHQPGVHLGVQHSTASSALLQHCLGQADPVELTRLQPPLDLHLALQQLDGAV